MREHACLGIALAWMVGADQEDVRKLVHLGVSELWPWRRYRLPEGTARGQVGVERQASQRDDDAQITEEL
jgi:hypothetical protein